MSHTHQNDWSLYLDDALPSSVREEWEGRLASCDECLAAYLRCLEARTERLPAPADEAALTERIVTAVRSRSAAPTAGGSGRRQPRPIDRQTLRHYAIAACVTVVLMGAGAFQQLLAHSSEAAAIAARSRPEPVSHQILKMTVSMIDALHPAAKGGWLK